MYFLVVGVEQVGMGVVFFWGGVVVVAGIVVRSLVGALLFFYVFSSVSVTESPLSLLLFRLKEMSMFSVFSI